MDAADQGEGSIDVEGGPLTEAGADGTLPAGEGGVAPSLEAVGPGGPALQVKLDVAASRP